MTTVYPDATGSIFGRIVTGADVEEWTVALIRRWIGTYLSEVERQHGLHAGHYARPRSYVVAPTFDQWPEDQLPRLVVVSTGIAERPLMTGAGLYSTRWVIEVGCLVSARSEAEAHRMALDYGAALYTLLDQRPSLDGRAQGIDWQGFAIEDQLDYDDTRSLSAGVASFTVLVEETVDANGGPATPDAPHDPDTDPWADWPRVETTEVVVENVGTEP